MFSRNLEPTEMINETDPQLEDFEMRCMIEQQYAEYVEEQRQHLVDFKELFSM